MKSVKAPSENFEAIGRTHCNEIQYIETFAKSESATNFKGFVLELVGDKIAHAWTSILRHMNNAWS